MPMHGIASNTDSIDTETVVGGACIWTGRNMTSLVLLLLASKHRQCFAAATHLQKCQSTNNYKNMRNVNKSVQEANV